MNRSPSPIERRVQRVADDFAKRGFRVWVESAPNRFGWLPDEVHPDLVAERGDERVIVEVKASGAIKGDTAFEQLARWAESVPNVRLELVVVDDDELASANTPAILPPDRVRERVSVVERLIAEDDHEGAAVLLWLTVENVLRARIVDVDLRRNRPLGSVGLVKTLYGYGLVTDEEFRELGRLAAFRNAAAHGAPTDLGGFARADWLRVCRYAIDWLAG